MSVYIISELCGQWGGSVRRAEQMILQSKMGGADAVKVQLYDTYRMPGENREKWEYLSMNRDNFKRLKEFADRINIDFFASAFHEDRIEWMLSLGIKVNKVASSILDKNCTIRKEIFDNNLHKFDKTFVSLGQWNQDQLPIEDGRIVYFHCIPKYPHEKYEAINNMPDQFIDNIIGYSDHSIGIDACVESVKRGAKYIEKHFTTDHNLQSLTESAHLCSMNYDQLVNLRIEVDRL